MVFCRRGTEEREGGNWREGEIQLNHWSQDGRTDGWFSWLDGLSDGWVIDGRGKRETHGGRDSWRKHWKDGCESDG